jgi:hypothetical protein
MEKIMGALLMVIFGVSGAGAAVLAWFFPSLHLDKITGSLIGGVGVGFAVFQALKFALSAHEDEKRMSVSVRTEEKH